VNSDLVQGVGRLVALSFVALVAFSAFEATFALFGRKELHFGLASTGAVFTGVGVMIAVVQGGFVHPVVARLGEVGTVRLGLVVNAAGLAVLAAVHSWALLVVALLALTVGQGLLSPALSSALAERSGSRRRGEVLGVQQAAGGLARVVGPIAGGVLFEHVSVPAPYLAGAILTVLALFLAS
jgi:MFS transporter, DHA1 family, tetracycline resistance protein